MSTHENTPTPPAAAPTPTLPAGLRRSLIDFLGKDDGLAAIRFVSEYWPRRAAVTTDARELAEKVVTRIEGTFRDWLMAGERSKAIEEVAAVLAEVVARAEAAEKLLDERASDTEDWATVMSDVHQYFADEKADRSRGRGTLLLTLLGNLRNERDALRAEVERPKSVVEARIQEIKHGWSEHDRLHAQLAAAQADTKRLDWLEGGGFDQRVARTFNIWQGGGMKFRAALDAARKEVK